MKELESLSHRVFIHLSDSPEVIESHDFWGGANIIENEGRLYRVQDAVNNPNKNETHVYAYPLGDDNQSIMKTAFDTWSKTK